MLLEQTHEKLVEMKLYGMASSIKERLERVDHQSLSKAEILGLLVDDEWLYRENRKLTARLKVAKFKEREAAIENIDYRTPRGLRKTQVLELAQNRWIVTSHHLLQCDVGLFAAARVDSFAVKQPKMCGNLRQGKQQPPRRDTLNCMVARCGATKFGGVFN